MPPKKGKKSKKQLEEEKKQREEEERIAAELEAKRQAEEAERRRIEEERLRKEEEKRLAEEMARLKEEEPDNEVRKTNMEENRVQAAKARVKDLPDKYLACDPLPDPEEERDITTFITLWSEGKDKTHQDMLNNCQTSEAIIQRMQNIYGEALATFDEQKQAWCHMYRDELRKISLRKFDEITAYMMEYIENYIQQTEEEKQKKAQQKTAKKGDQDYKDFTLESASTRDFFFGFWANISGKSQAHQEIPIGEYRSCLPIKHASQHLIYRCIWTGFDYLSINNMQNDIVIGGIIDFQMFVFPEICEKKLKWVIRSVNTVEDRLKRIPYPDPALANSDSAVAGVTMVYKLPNYVFTTEDTTNVKIGVWDEESQCWTTDYISGELEFKKSSRTIEFATTKFAPIALLQSRCMDYPYENWSLRCVSNEVAILTLHTKRVELNIEIGPLYVKLIENKTLELYHLQDKEMTPGYLLMELSKCGIHLLPRNEDAKLAGIQEKSRAAEERAIQDVAIAVRAFHFRRSKWNQTVDSESIVLKVRENLEFDREYHEDHEPDWRYMKWWSDKCSFVRCREDRDKCDDRICEGMVTHSLFEQAIAAPNASEQAFSTCRDYSYIEFADTLIKTLRLLRLFSFS